MEENIDLEIPAPQKKKVTTTINYNLWRIANMEGWAWNDLLEFAINFKRADKDMLGYPNCNLSNQLQKLTKKLEGTAQELYELKENETTPPKSD